MKNLTYERYLSDETLRREIYLKASRERAEMFDRLIVRPIARLFSPAARRRGARASRLAAWG